MATAFAAPVQGKEWKEGSCHTYLHVDTPAEEADEYVKMAATLGKRSDHLSTSVYTQTTDVELECDGFLVIAAVLAVVLLHHSSGGGNTHSENAVESECGFLVITMAIGAMTTMLAPD